jgi:hypothetical protein
VDKGKEQKKHWPNLKIKCSSNCQRCLRKNVKFWKLSFTVDLPNLSFPEKRLSPYLTIIGQKKITNWLKCETAPVRF